MSSIKTIPSSVNSAFLQFIFGEVSEKNQTTTMCHQSINVNLWEPDWALSDEYILTG